MARYGESVRLISNVAQMLRRAIADEGWSSIKSQAQSLPGF
ncbi:MAG: hypothetical protein ACFCBU_13840 [Cyanophyceae cyanobacterium]